MAPRPYTLVAELTYKCPLRCAYCSNPTELEKQDRELTTDEWERVLSDAEAIGVMGVNLTGGEPLLRRDLEQIVTKARSLALYTNLITSGLPLTRERLGALRDAGLDHVQLSFQDVLATSADRIAGVAAFDAKMEVAAWVKELGLPLTINIVLHAENVDRTAAAVELAERLQADRLELAHTQYLGWALTNRDRLLPSPAQIEASRAVGQAAKARLAGRMDVLMVLPDYVAGHPRACMDGWGKSFIIVSPDGLVLPCQAAHTIPGLGFESIRGRGLAEIWTSSPSFERFRGEAWMPEPCKSCDRRTIDFGGCRCQAFHLTGNAASTDPVCSKSKDHEIVALAFARASAHGANARPELVPRRLPVVRPR
jgi:pyrroloquinoline quinone biosynthesis protein E